MWGVEVQIHSLFTSALDGGKWSASRSGRFTPGAQSQYPMNMRLGGPQGRAGRFGENKNLLQSAGFEARTVQPVA